MERARVVRLSHFERLPKARGSLICLYEYMFICGQIYMHIYISLYISVYRCKNISSSDRDINSKPTGPLICDTFRNMRFRQQKVEYQRD